MFRKHNYNVIIVVMRNSHVITNNNKCVISITKHNVFTHILHLRKYVVFMYVVIATHTWRACSRVLYVAAWVATRTDK